MQSERETRSVLRQAMVRMWVTAAFVLAGCGDNEVKGGPYRDVEIERTLVGVALIPEGLANNHPCDVVVDEIMSRLDLQDRISGQLIIRTQDQQFLVSASRNDSQKDWSVCRFEYKLNPNSAGVGDFMEDVYIERDLVITDEQEVYRYRLVTLRAIRAFNESIRSGQTVQVHTYTEK